MIRYTIQHKEYEENIRRTLFPIYHKKLCQNLTMHSIYQYNALLSRRGLDYIYKHNIISTVNGEMKTTNTMYPLYCGDPATPCCRVPVRRCCRVRLCNTGGQSRSEEGEARGLWSCSAARSSATFCIGFYCRHLSQHCHC